MTPSKSSLEDKYAIITGGTQGLGEATARLFARRGARGLLLTGRNSERGETIARELNGAGCETHFIAAELEDVSACRDIVARADEAFGAIHVLVNCAAATDRGSIWDTSPQLFDRIMRVNVRAPFFLMQDTIKVMEREKIAGSIVNITSVAAHGSLPFLSAYATSKGALVVLTKNVAYSVMRRRIRVNAINLGWMDTPAEDAIQRRYHSNGEAWLQKAQRGLPFGRLIHVDEAARTIAFVASEESGMMTGAVLDLDQSVIGAGDAPAPPPIEEWPPVEGVEFS